MSASTSSGTPEPQSQPRPRLYPDEAGWDRMRPVFTRLYRDEGRTLKECMEIIEADHGFHGTTKMYKNRITEWGLDKRLKRDEVIQMYHMHRTRFAAGRKSEFYIRDRKVDWASVQKFLKRRPQLRAKYDAGTLEIGNADLGIVVRSPSPEPAEVPKVHVLFPMDAGEGLRLPEEIVRITRDFCDGALDGGIWVPDIQDGGFLDGRGGYPAYVNLQNWYRPLWSVRAMLNGGEVGAAFALLNILLDKLHEIVHMEGLYLMFYIWDFADMLRSCDPKLAEMLVKHTAEVMRIVFGPRHPLRMMWDKIEELPAAERHQAIARTMDSVLDYINKRYGAKDINSFEITRLYIRKLSLDTRGKDPNGYLTEIERRAGVLINDSDDENQICDMMSRVALARLSAGKFEEAETALARIEPYSLDPANHTETNCWLDVRWDYFLGRANACVANGQLEQAGYYLRELVAHSREYRGHADPRTVEALEKTVLHYRAYGPVTDLARWEYEYKQACLVAVEDYRAKAVARKPSSDPSTSTPETSGSEATG
ncbi:hypothetical protein GQ53DRAFT_328141 [Thozetella sp. PMI_491]|nr:hypothetical protein GQ53DRAFT_328141 [Thozetella sp. PMI_491]